MKLLTYALGVLSVQFCLSCNSTGGNDSSAYQPPKEVLFDGNFRGQLGPVPVSVSLKNIAGNVTGTYANSEGNFTISGAIDAGGVLNAKMNNGLLNLDCKGYYSGYNLVLELDEDFINLVRLAMLIDGDGELAAQINGKLVLQKQ